MFDIIIVAIAVTLSVIYFVLKIIRFLRKPAGSSACGCSSSDCSSCPARARNITNCCE